MTEPSSLASLRGANNQAPPLVGHNVVTSDVALTEALTRHGSADLVDDLALLGLEAGTAEARQHGMLANQHHPELTREPEVLEAWITEVGMARGADHRLDRASYNGTLGTLAGGDLRAIVDRTTPVL